MNKNLKGFIIKIAVGLITGVLISMFIVKPIAKSISDQQVEEKSIHVREEIKEEEIKNIKEEEIVEEIKNIKEEEIVEETFYFNKNDVSMVSNNVTKNDLRIMLEGTELESLANSFIELEDKYGVNAVFVAAIACVESAYGSSDIAKEFNNITSIMKGDGTPRYYNSKYECLEATYKLLSNHYVDPNGKWYTGLDIYSINTVYCPNDNGHWSKTVSSVMERLISKL